jgi:hypothetical protein
MTQTMLPPAQTAQAQPVYEITEEDKKRIQRIADAWKAYNGELAPPLQKMPDGTDPNVMSNRCGPIVKAGVGLLFGKELEISVEKGAPQEAQDFLNTTWGRKEQRIPLLQDLAMNGAIAGCGFLRIVPGKAGKFRLVVVDPSIVVGMQTAPQDCETVLLYCIQYSQMEKIDGRPREVFYREEIMRIDPDGNAARDMPDDDDTWQIQHWTQVGQTGMQPKLTGWTAAGPPIVWSYPFPPLFKCKNMPNPNDPWGEPDITPDLIGENKSINLIQSCIALIEILYGHPFLVGEGIGESSVDRQPGRVMIIAPGGKVYSVQITSDVANALIFLKKLQGNLDEESGVAGIAVGRIEDMPRGNISGIALELYFMSALMKTEGKRCRYGELIIDVSKALLVLNHMSGDIDMELAWQNPLPHDDLPSLQAAVTKLEIGVSKQSVLEEAGYDPDEEQKRNDEEDQHALEKQQAQQAALIPPELPGAPALPGQPLPAQPQQGGKP